MSASVSVALEPAFTTIFAPTVNEPSLLMLEFPLPTPPRLPEMAVTLPPYTYKLPPGPFHPPPTPAAMPGARAVTVPP